MAIVTRIKTIVESYSYDNFSLTPKERIEIARPYIFNFEYPIWDINYKPVLETKIIKHFYTKEIGFETYPLWQFYLEERLNLIMPYYNKLYATTVKDYDYLTNVKLTETYSTSKNSKVDTTNSETTTKEDIGNGTQTINESTTGKNIQSDTPQVNYSGVDYATDYIDSTGTKDNTVTTDNNNTTNVGTSGENHSTVTDSESYTKDNTGNTGSHSFTELLMEYRESLINIDQLILNELKDMFLMIY